jgi:5-methylcytosine-specific restriction endonuclease McrA
VTGNRRPRNGRGRAQGEVDAMAKQPKADYWELLRHPNWQRKRLEIMQRANFRCEWCGTDGVTLNVHHSYYEKDKAPWDYPDESLHCLCEPCHKKFQNHYDQIKRMLGWIGIENNEQLLGYMTAMLVDKANDISSVILTSHEFAQGFGDFYGLNPETLIDACSDGGVLDVLKLKTGLAIIDAAMLRKVSGLGNQEGDQKVPVAGG